MHITKKKASKNGGLKIAEIVMRRQKFYNYSSLSHVKYVDEIL